MEVLHLPTLPLNEDETITSVEIPVAVEDVKLIREIGRDKELNILKLFLAGLGILLWEYTAQQEIIISISPLKLPDEDIHGKGTLHCKLNMHKDVLVQSLLDQIHETLNDAYLNSEYDEEQFLAIYSAQNGGNLLPITSIGFNYQKINATGSWLLQHHLLFEFIEDTSSAIRVTSKLSSFPQQMLQNMGESLLLLVLELSKNKSKSITSCTILPTTSLKLWQEQFEKNNRNYPIHTTTVIDLFIQNATKNPDKTALVYGEKTITYTELNKWSAQIATFITQHSDKTTGVLVGVMLERSAALVATVLGILRAGSAYVPIDPDYPTERIRNIIKDTACTIVFTENNQDQINIDGCKFANITTIPRIEKISLH